MQSPKLRSKALRGKAEGRRMRCKEGDESRGFTSSSWSRDGLVLRVGMYAVCQFYRRMACRTARARRGLRAAAGKVARVGRDN